MVVKISYHDKEIRLNKTIFIIITLIFILLLNFITFSMIGSYNNEINNTKYIKCSQYSDYKEEITDDRMYYCHNEYMYIDKKLQKNIQLDNNLLTFLNIE